MSEPAGVDLYWIPLGTGGHVVRLNGLVYEALVAWREHRPRRDLYHSGLEVHLPDAHFAIEVTPIPDARGAERGVVSEGPVGMRLAGKLRLFRYEIRRWEGGRIPDAEAAVGGPIRVSDDIEVARRVLALIPSVPTPVWGRDQLGAGEMWNSNSVMAWLLERAGVETDQLQPPANGRAPGWTSGLIVARRGPS